MYKITKIFEFEASHKLFLDYESACSNIHGHSYKAEVSVFGTELNKNGMIMDFTELKQIKNWVMDNWDHALIIPKKIEIEKSVIEFAGKIHNFEYENVTAELMAKYLHSLCEMFFGIGKYTYSIVIWETSNNRAEYSS